MFCIKTFRNTALTLIATAGMAAASCAPIAEPAAMPGAETFKNHVLAGEYQAAVDMMGLSAADASKLVENLKANLPGAPSGCITARRVSQSDNWVSEVVLYHGHDGHFYLTLTGAMAEGRFHLLDFNISSKFSDIEGFLY